MCMYVYVYVCICVCKYVQMKQIPLLYFSIEIEFPWDTPVHPSGQTVPHSLHLECYPPGNYTSGCTGINLSVTRDYPERYQGIIRDIYCLGCYLR